MDEPNLKVTEYLEEGANFFLILDAVFLADALRRLKREFSRNKKFHENQKVMLLHVFVICGHSVVMVASAIVMSHAALHGNQRNLAPTLIAYAVQVTTQSVAQFVTLYLFTKLSEPVNFSGAQTLEIAKTDEEDEVLEQWTPSDTEDEVSIDTEAERFYDYIYENITFKPTMQVKDEIDNEDEEKLVDTKTSAELFYRKSSKISSGSGMWKKND